MIVFHNSIFKALSSVKSWLHCQVEVIRSNPLNPLLASLPFSSGHIFHDWTTTATHSFLNKDSLLRVMNFSPLYCDVWAGLTSDRLGWVCHHWLVIRLQCRYSRGGQGAGASQEGNTSQHTMQCRLCVHFYNDVPLALVFLFFFDDKDPKCPKRRMGALLSDDLMSFACVIERNFSSQFFFSQFLKY